MYNERDYLTSKYKITQMSWHSIKFNKLSNHVPFSELLGHQASSSHVRVKNKLNKINPILII